MLQFFTHGVLYSQTLRMCGVGCFLPAIYLPVIDKAGHDNMEASAWDQSHALTLQYTSEKGEDFSEHMQTLTDIDI